MVVSEQSLWDVREGAAQGPIEALVAVEFPAFEASVEEQANALLGGDGGYTSWEFQGDSVPTWWMSSGVEATLTLTFSAGGCTQTAVVEPSFFEDV